MSLSCDCGYGDYDWYYEITDEPYTANSTGRCYGCGGHVRAGDIVRHILDIHWPESDDDLFYDETDPDEKVLGRICERCGDLYDSLTELGFCMTAEFGFIEAAMEEYRRDYAKHVANDS